MLVETTSHGVSRHLRILHDAGLVKVRADGRRRMYALRPEPMRVLAKWMRRYAHEEVHRLERLGRSRGISMTKPTPHLQEISELEFRVNHMIKVPWERIFDAYTEPEQITQWWSRPGQKMRIDEMDVRPAAGGASPMSKRTAPSSCTESTARLRP